MSPAPIHLPITVTKHLPRAMEHMEDMDQKLPALPYAAMDEVPKVLTILDIATLEKWKRKFSKAPGMEMDTINVMIGMDKGKILLKERETILSFFFRAMTITIEAINLPMRVGMATPRTPRWRMNIPMKFPITLMAFINTETFIMTLVLPMALNMAVEAEYIPWKGQERAVTKR